MNIVRFELLRRLKLAAPDVYIHISYGARTSTVRREHSISKSHTNDACCLGKFFPKHRAPEVALRKVRRNNRILQKFYDAVYIDTRTRQKARGQELTNGRISRNRKKDHEDLHPFRSRRVSKGRITVRRSHTTLKLGSLIEFNGKILAVHGTHKSRHTSKRTGKVTISINVEFEWPTQTGRKIAALGRCRVIRQAYNTGWEMVAAAEI